MRARAAVLANALVVLAAAANLAACSSAIAPDTWATSVCQALGPWRTQITSLNQRAQAEITKASTPSATRTHLHELLSGAANATETARASVVAAGVPDVEGGAVIAKRFVTSLTEVRDAYRHADTTVEALSTSDADTFYSQVGTAMDTLNADYAHSGVDTVALNSVALQQDFAKVPACR